MKQNKIIFYHQNCPDGFSAAWAAWKKFGSKARYIPMKHIDPIPKNITGKELYFLDITYVGKKLDEIIKKAKHVTVIDHHISAKEEIGRADTSLYDTRHSGAVLAWKFFHPEKPTPYFLRLIEEGDLWKYASPHVKEILASGNLTPFTFSAWSKLVRDIESVNTRKKHIEIGRAIFDYENKRILELVPYIEEGVLDGYNAGILNSPFLQSQIGAMLYDDPRFKIGIVWYRRNGIIKVSLRAKNGNPDVSKIAQKYGGGGHKAAAGFEFPATKPVPWKYKKRS